MFSLSLCTTAVLLAAAASLQLRMLLQPLQVTGGGEVLSIGQRCCLTLLVAMHTKASAHECSYESATRRKNKKEIEKTIAHHP